ncbi:TPA: hypothetical protein ACF5Y5_002808, partial [Staphylococcus aureus]
MNKVKVKSIKNEKSGWFFITNKEELIFSAQKIFNFSFPAIPSIDLKLHKYKELEEVNIYYLPIEPLFDREISRKQEWKISSNLELDNNLYGEYEIETNGLYNTILKIEYEKMSIVVSPKLIKPMLQSENFNEYLILDVDDNEHDFDKELVIKKRPLPKLWHFHTYVVKSTHFKTDKWDLREEINKLDIISENLDIWDVFIRYKINNQISDKYLLVNDSFDKKIFTNNGVNFIFYKTKSNSLAI